VDWLYFLTHISVKVRFSTQCRSFTIYWQKEYWNTRYGYEVHWL